MLCPPPWSCLALVSGLVSYFGWGAASASLVSSSSCLRSCLPSWLRCCVGLPGLFFLLSLVLSPNLSPVWGAVSASLVLSCSCLRSCLPACLSLVSQLVSGLAMLLSVVWDAVSASLVLSCSCLPTCLPSGLGCCALLSPVLSPNKSPVVMQ